MAGNEKLASFVENPIMRAIQRGMLLALPIIMVGSFSLMIRSLPISGYSEMLRGLLNGVVFEGLSYITSATLDIVSLIFILTIAYSYGQIKETPVPGTVPLIALASFLIFCAIPGEPLGFEIFRSGWLFNALIVSISSSVIFVWVWERQRASKHNYSDGTFSLFNQVSSSTFPAIITLGIFTIMNLAFAQVFGENNIQTMISIKIVGIFQNLGDSVISGMLFIFIMHIMWLFGIHGANVLDDAAKVAFNATDIVNKTLLDAFVFLGGCGSLIALLIALIIFDKRKHTRGLAKMAALPVLFNINELILFGLPIVLNPIFLIPFMIVPMVMFLLSYGAFYLELVPPIVNTVEWTTPIFLSGYVTTESIWGAILQLICLIIGIAIYSPFVKKSVDFQASIAKRQIDSLRNLIVLSEENGEYTGIMNQPMAKELVAQLKHDIREKKIPMHYQPQVAHSGKLVGAEALLRWEYPGYGIVYPPLVVMLAKEAEISYELGDAIFETVCFDISNNLAPMNIDIHISYNISPEQLKDKELIGKMEAVLKAYTFGKCRIGMEITEEVTLSGSKETLEILEKIRAMGLDILMDDFGMGHSSIKYLQEVTFSVVKLDGSLIHGLGTNQHSREIISTIMGLSKKLGFKVVAEKVEKEEQREELHVLGCDIYQGYLYSKALPIEEFFKYAQGFGS